MLSGIGPAAHLAEMGIPCVADLPVGKNFHDHLHMSVNATIHGNNSFFGEDKGLKSVKHLLQWLTTRSGLLTSNILEGGAFVDTCDGGRPDIQLHFLPVLDNFDNTPGEKRPRASMASRLKSVICSRNHAAKYGLAAAIRPRRSLSMPTFWRNPMTWPDRFAPSNLGYGCCSNPRWLLW
jgi:Choline dehydrogenase and related flavoproteins